MAAKKNAATVAKPKKAVNSKPVPRESGESIELFFKGKVTSFGVHRMNTSDALNYIEDLSGLEEGEEQLVTVQRYLLLNGKFAFKNTKEVDTSLGGLDVLQAYKKVVAVNRVAEFVESIRSERDLLKK